MKLVKSMTGCLLLAGALGWNLLVQADGYTVEIGDGAYEDVAFSFQTNTVENSLSGMGNEVTLYYWNWANQTYDIITYYVDGGQSAWDQPNFLLETGHAFRVLNPSGNGTLELGVSGTVRTNATFTMSLQTNKWYLVGSAYPLKLDLGTFLECVIPKPGAHWYTINSLNYQGSVGDKVFLWNGGDYQIDTRTNTPPNWQWSCKWDGEGVGVSPTISFSPDNGTGKGFWLLPASTNTWVHHKTGVSCQ